MPESDDFPGRGRHLVVVGEALLDVVAVSPEGDVHGRVSARAGGTASNAALAARALGAEATIIARVGADQVGAFLRESLEAAGVRLELAVDTERATGGYVQIGSTVAVDRGASSMLRASDIGGVVGDALLVSGYVLFHDDTADAGCAALESTARWRGADVGAAFLAARLGSRRVFERLANANLIFADEEEANVLTGLAPELAASALAESFEIAVVKTGASGAVAASRFGVVRAAPAAPHPIGPTAGAGDALDAGVLIGLSAGLELEPALVLGMRAAQWALGR